MGKHHVEHLYTNIDICLGQFTKGENFSIVQALFTSGASITYLQTGLVQQALRVIHVFGWAGVSRLFLQADGGQFWHSININRASHIFISAYKHMLWKARYKTYNENLHHQHHGGWNNLIWEMLLAAVYILMISPEFSSV